MSLPNESLMFDYSGRLVVICLWVLALLAVFCLFAAIRFLFSLSCWLSHLMSRAGVAAMSFADKLAFERDLERRAAERSAAHELHDKLREAISAFDIDRVRLIVDQKCPLISTTHTPHSALHFAADRDVFADSARENVLLGIMRCLLDAKCGIGYSLSDKEALCYASTSRVAKLLIEEKAEVTPSALASAVERFREDVVALLLEHKADPNAKDLHHETPLLAAISEAAPAIEQKQLRTIRHLLAAKANVNALVDGYRTIGFVQSLAVAELMIAARAEADETAIRNAVRKHQLELLRVLLRTPPNPIVYAGAVRCCSLQFVSLAVCRPRKPLKMLAATLSVCS